LSSRFGLFRLASNRKEHKRFRRFLSPLSRAGSVGSSCQLGSSVGQLGKTRLNSIRTCGNWQPTRYRPRLGFTVAHQYLHQLHADVRHAVLGNAGTIVSFRVGAEDATYLAREFHAVFNEADLLQLPNYRIYLKLMIDGMPSMPFSAITLPT